MRPAIASIPSNSKVQKASVIHRAVLCHIFFNSDMFLMVKALLKNHSWKLYSAIGNIYVLYNSCF